ncbi:hypothetical protein SAMN05421659_109110 [[Clostridium] fimetarium]|uniref:Uncharacterized protein n=1 Tax=[Clostridium] fimetarium TaxID=99656 RepID=A0A1I0QTR0_9FIRM|nr:hypothetical protein SAMN05421659_109110 [[Clostridium] fimetarium]
MKSKVIKEKELSNVKVGVTDKGYPLYDILFKQNL